MYSFPISAVQTVKFAFCVTATNVKSLANNHKLHARCLKIDML